MRTFIGRHPSRLFAAVVVLTVVGAADSVAQTTTKPQEKGGPSPSTSKIWVAGDSKRLALQGVAGRQVSRVVALSVADGSPAITDLTFVTTPLNPVDAGANAAPAPEVTWEPRSFRLEPGEPPVPVIVTVSLDGLSSGEYKSALRLVRPVSGRELGTHVEIEIPLDIKVHHDWPWPLAVLAAGVAIGMFFSWFRSTGKDRDVALTGRDGLVAIANDPTRPKLLTEALTPVTADIDDAITRSDWPAAQASVIKGEAIVYRWRRDKTDWEFLNDYLQSFQVELCGYPQGPLTVRALDEQIHKDGGKLASAETTEPLRAQLNLWRDQLELFRKTRQLLVDFAALRDQLPAEKVADFLTREKALGDRLDVLAPDDKLGYAKLQDDLVAETQTFQAMVPAHPRAAEGAAANLLSAGPLARQTSNVPTAAMRGWKDRVPTVNWLALGRATRLKVMAWLGYLFPAGVFVFTGLTQLYQSNPTFGSLGDYAALFLWGFGSDAGGSKLQDLMRQANGGSKLEEVIRQTADKPDAGATPKPDPTPAPRIG